MPTATSLSKEETARRSEAKLTAAQETLAAEVAALQSGEDWKRFLELQAKLHTYSANNAMLIAVQHSRAYAEGRVSTSEPTYVAGFNTWRALGRVVNKGQHGFGVLAPCRYDQRVATDTRGEARALRAGEVPAPGETLERHSVLRGFRIEHVFDVSQTSGVELPEPPRPRLLEGSAPPGLRSAVVALITDKGYRLEVVAGATEIGGANGQTDWGSKTVRVRGDMDEAAQVKTLIHEAGHVILHTGGPGMALPRALKEVEAESVAYVVAYAHGMATGDYSFAYVATWAGEGAARALQATQQRVATAAREIIEASPAAHVGGGRVPGAEVAIAAAKVRRAERDNRASSGASVVPEQAQAVGL